MTDSKDGSPTRTFGAREVERRIRLAEIIACVGLVAAFIGAIGPAEEIRTTYSWPPRMLSDVTPSRLWYTPLLLASRIPDRIEARIPCARPESLPRASQPLTVLATARAPERAGGLAVTSNGRTLTFKIGDTVLARLPESTGGLDGTGCRYELAVAMRRWSLDGGPTRRTISGELAQMPVVNGLFSGVDLRSATRPSVAVTTQPHRTVTTLRQSLAWVIATICALAALLLVAFPRRPRIGWRGLVRLARNAVSSATAADVAIGVVLLGWWILSPSFYDDGWTIARQRAFTTAGGFSQYYEAFGVNLPLGYWLEWVQHWLTTSTDALVFLRIPALVCLAVTWVLCRWILAQLLPPLSPGHTHARWALAVSFAAMAMAWGMTLRQEPAVTLLVAGVTACAVQFRQVPGPRPLAIAAILVPLALTAHPTGIVSLAPLLAIVPPLARWIRQHLPSAVALVGASAALLVTLAFVGSDVEQRARDAQTMSAVSTTVVDWRQELSRYMRVSEIDPDGLSGFATPLRRASVALMVLATLAFVARGRRGGRTALDLPSITLLLALALFLTTPSKWPWHFGALIALVALAAAAETARLRAELAESKSWRMRPLIAVGALLLAIAWSWTPRGAWNIADLRTLDWTPAFEAWLPTGTLAVALPLVILAVAGSLARRRGTPVSRTPWQVASWSAVLLAVPVMLFTIGMLTVDAVRTPSWTLARQNVEALLGRSSCGLAEHLDVPVAASTRPLSYYVSVAKRETPGWVPRHPDPALPRFALGPVSEGASFTPWFVVPFDRRFGLFISGEPERSDRLFLEWGRSEARGRPEVLQMSRIVLRPAPETGAIVPWRFISASGLPRGPRAATIVRVRLVNDTSPGAAIAATAPVAYGSERLERRLSATGSSALTQANLVTFFPCSRLPRIEDGIVEAPRTLITTRDSITPTRYATTSPFAGVLDLYGLERIPLSDSQNPHRSLVIFGVQRRIRGAQLARVEVVPPLGS